MIAPADVLIGILAGGRATRLGGLDKPWCEFEGEALVLRTLRGLAGQGAAARVSANLGADRYRRHGLEVVADRMPGQPGPLAGLDALLAACPRPWLLTVPVDLEWIPEDLAERLAAAATGSGAMAEDEDGLQPLVALWRCERCRQPVAEALAAGDLAVHPLRERLGLGVARLSGLRLGNLNAPEDFRADD